MHNNGEALSRIFHYRDTGLPEPDCGGPIIAIYVVLGAVALAGLVMSLMARRKA